MAAAASEEVALERRALAEGETVAAWPESPAPEPAIRAALSAAGLGAAEGEWGRRA